MVKHYDDHSMAFDTPRDNEAEILALIANFEGDLMALPYYLLFWQMGINPDDAVTAIPFLKKDIEYSAIPGQKVRINNLDGVYPSEDYVRMEQIRAVQQAWLPDIELQLADLSVEFPPGLVGNTDLLILNHGIILNELPGGYRQYLENAGQVVKEGGLIMVIDNGDLELAEIEELTGCHQIDIKFSDQVKQALEQKGIRSGTANNLGDLINLPESNQGHQVLFLRK